MPYIDDETWKKEKRATRILNYILLVNLGLVIVWGYLTCQVCCSVVNSDGNTSDTQRQR